MNRNHCRTKHTEPRNVGLCSTIFSHSRFLCAFHCVRHSDDGDEIELCRAADSAVVVRSYKISIFSLPLNLRFQPTPVRLGQNEGCTRAKARGGYICAEEEDVLVPTQKREKKSSSWKKELVSTRSSAMVVSALSTMMAATPNMAVEWQIRRRKTIENRTADYLIFQK